MVSPHVWEPIKLTRSPFNALTSIIPLYYLIRKPTHILDFSLTLLFNHVFISTYSTGSFPTSLFFWVVMLTGAIIMIVGAEQVRS
jgi:hypothetical protein